MSVRSHVPKSRSVQGRGPVSRVPRSLTVPGINRLSTFTLTRASVAWGWDSQSLLQEYAVDTPVREYDPGTGVYLGLRAEESRTNSRRNSRDLSASTWGKFGGVTVTQNAAGADGQANKAWTIEDGSTSDEQFVSVDETVADDNNAHVRYLLVAKDGDESRFPRFDFNIVGGTTTVLNRYWLNTKTGATAELSPGEITVKDAGDWWVVKQVTQNNGSGNTTLRSQILPAESDTFGSPGSGTPTGSIIVDFPQAELQDVFYTSPIVTDSSTKTRAEDVIEQSITDTGNGFLVEGTYGGGTDVVVRQLDDGTTDNRIRLYVDSNNKLLFQIDNGGVQQCSIDTGAIAVDGKFKVAVDYTGGSVSVSRDGNAVQTATATIPSVNMDRYARNHQETLGRFWFIESNCYVFDGERTDSQLEALSA